MATLFSYCVLYDSGAAPNPYWSVCTLAICKPVIRRTAQVGDWIVGTGSKNYGFDNQVIYAMKVTGVMSFKEYDAYCKLHLPDKIPNVDSKDARRIVGDCIYDYDVSDDPIIREGVHTEENKSRDIGGVNVLLSTHFYYFGSNPVPLPTHLLKIVNQGQGHKSKSNDGLVSSFVEWMDHNFSQVRNKVLNSPYGLKDMLNNECVSTCGRNNLVISEEDEKIELAQC